MPYTFGSRHEYLRTRMRGVNSAEIIYCRGKRRVANVAATVYELKPDEMIPYGVPLDIRRRDYIIDVSVLEGAANPFRCPKQGDIIIDGNLECQVTPMGEEPAFRYTNNRRTAYRIHTQVITET